jgi:hypothetical protein
VHPPHVKHSSNVIPHELSMHWSGSDKLLLHSLQPSSQTIPVGTYNKVSCHSHKSGETYTTSQLDYSREWTQNEFSAHVTLRHGGEIQVFVSELQPHVRSIAVGAVQDCTLAEGWCVGHRLRCVDRSVISWDEVWEINKAYTRINDLVLYRSLHPKRKTNQRILNNFRWVIDSE